MATNVMASFSRVVIFKAGLRNLSTNLKLSSRAIRSSVNLTNDLVEAVGADTNLFGPSDKRLVLPGNVGIPSDHQQKEKKAIPERRTEPDILACKLPEQHYFSVLSQHYDNTKHMPKDRKMSDPSETLELKAQACPYLMRIDFQVLFPEAEIVDKPLTVLTFSQKTKTDMAAWSEDMESERDALTKDFVSAAESVCTNLQARGFWADFIDPSSGMAYYGRYTQATLYETDERYRHLGFTIEDMGCCRVIKHSRFGTSVFVGSIVTTAPLHSDALAEIMAASVID